MYSSPKASPAWQTRRSLGGKWFNSVVNAYPTGGTFMLRFRIPTLSNRPSISIHELSVCYEPSLRSSLRSSCAASQQ